MSQNQDTTTTVWEQHPDPCGMPQAPTPPCPTTTVPDQNTPTTVVTIPCTDQNCGDPGFTPTATTAVVAQQDQLPATGADTLLLGGAALAFVAVGAVIARAARREHRGLGR